MRLPDVLHYAADRSSRPRHIRSHRKRLILAENCRKGAENRAFIGRMRVQDLRDRVVVSVAAGWSCCATAALLCPPPLGPGSTPSTERAPLVHGRDHLDLDHRLRLSEAADLDRRAGRTAHSKYRMRTSEHCENAG